MAFKLPDEWITRKEEIYNLKYISMDNQEIHVSQLKDKSVTPEMHSKMRMNSYAQEDLPPKLTDETLIEKTKYYLSQCSRKNIPCSTYDEAVIHNLMPEFIKRLEEYTQLKERVEVIEDTVGFKL